MGQKAQSHEEHERTKVYQGVDDDGLTGRFSHKAKTNVQKSMQDKADDVEEQTILKMINVGTCTDARRNSQNIG